MTVFESTAADIARLSPKDLGQLVRRLCEAELAALGYPRSAVTAGGHPLAADGGVDVRVEVQPAEFHSDFLPAPLVLFQVKQESRAFGPARIRKEIAPRGSFRPALGEAARRGGAYIIVSGKETLTDLTLNVRRQAMRDVLTAHDVSGLHVDFHDGARVARWVDCYPAVALWLRDRLGTPVFGWRPFGSWSWPEGVDDDEYIPDEKARLSLSTKGKHDALPIIAGIEAIRASIALPGGIVRIVGLSGTGKTRLAQALFDERVGANALPREVALYTDAGTGPQPSAREMLARLIAEQRRHVLVIDNAGADLHRDLADQLRRDAGQISLLTIEFDITADEPEATDVFQLDVASDGVIRNLLECRESSVSATDRETIVRLSDGNACIALALARAVHGTGSFAGLNDRQVFERLFWQRDSRDDALLHAAKVCSLVYSFDGETREGIGAELPALAELAGQTFDELYRHAATLLRRGLMQRRGRWRAVLPQALSLRLAAWALEELHPDLLCLSFGQRAPKRLLRSFARQLGFLHTSATARAISGRWLRPDGLVVQACLRDEPMAFEILAHLAPVDPAAALRAIECLVERAIADNSPPSWFVERGRLVTLLRHLAYMTEMFPRAVQALARIALTERESDTSRIATDAFCSLFRRRFSGTCAQPEQRSEVLNFLIRSDHPASVRLGVAGIIAMLDFGPLTSSFDPAFGAHRRDHGYGPRTHDEFVRWCRVGLGLVREAARKGCEQAAALGQSVATTMRRFAALPTLHADFRETAESIGGSAVARSAWLNLCRSRADEQAGGANAQRAILSELEGLLRPVALIDRIRAFVGCYSDVISFVLMPDDADDDWGLRLARVETEMRSLGNALASDDEALRILARELVTGTLPQAVPLGVGLAEGTWEFSRRWDQFCAAFSRAPASERNPSILAGFLKGASRRDPHWVERALDDASNDPTLVGVFVFLQIQVLSCAGALRRLQEALLSSQVPASELPRLVYAGLHRAFDDDQLASIIDVLLTRPDGSPTALGIVEMRLLEQGRDPPVGRLIEASCQALMRYDFGTESSSIGVTASRVATMVLESGRTDVAAALCRNFIAWARGNSTWMFARNDILEAVFRHAPKAALTELLLRSAEGCTLLAVAKGSDSWTPVVALPVEAGLGWAAQEPSRFATLAQVVPLFLVDGLEKASGLNPLAVGLIRSAPNKHEILNAFLGDLHISGGLVNEVPLEIARRRDLLRSLADGKDAVVADWLREADRTLESQVAHWTDWAHERDERFE